MWMRSLLTASQQELLETIGIKKLPAVVPAPARLSDEARKRTASARQRRRANREL